MTGTQMRPILGGTYDIDVYSGGGLPHCDSPQCLCEDLLVGHWVQSPAICVGKWWQKRAAVLQDFHWDVSFSFCIKCSGFVVRKLW